jgi:hypothetical protein
MNMVKTENIMVTTTNIKYRVFICEGCKRYYIKRFNKLIEVQYNQSGDKWTQTGVIID